MSHIAKWIKDNLFVIICGLLMEAAFALYHPQVPLTPLLGTSPWLIKVGFGTLFPVAIAFFPYVLGFLLARRNRQIDIRLIAIFGALFAVTLISASLPTFSEDIHGYVFWGRALPTYGADPYTVMSRDFPNEPFSHSSTWTAWVNPYGPLWTAMSSLVMLVAGRHDLAALILFKLLMCLALFGTVGLLLSLRVQVANEDGERPGSRPDWLLLILWNPFVLFEALQNGHNDIVMIFFLMASVWLLFRDRRELSAVSLAAAVLVKYTALILIPFFLVALWKRRRGVRRQAISDVAVYIISGAFAGLVLIAPFWNGGSMLVGLKNQLGLHGILPFFGWLPHFLLLTFRETIGFPILQALHLTETVSLAVFVAAYVGLLLWHVFNKKQGVRDLAGACFLALAAYLLLQTFWFMPWYFLWLIPFAFLAEHYVIFLAVTVSGIFAYQNEAGLASSWLPYWLALRYVWKISLRRWPRLADRLVR